MSDTFTILNLEPGRKAVKEYTVLADGSVEKKAYGMGTMFTAAEMPVSSLDDIQTILQGLQDCPDKVIIRGKLKAGFENQNVYRRIHGELAAFDAAARHWVMIDMDKKAYPEHLHIKEKPEEVILWLKQQLPPELKSTKCVYKFSSSQNVPQRINEEPEKTVSAHLYYWCDRPVSDLEWKAYLKSYDCKVDYSLFNPVQPHYTAKPIFHGMADPMPERMGIC